MAASMILAWLVAVLLVPCVHSQHMITTRHTVAGGVIGEMSWEEVDGRRVQVDTHWAIPYARPPIGPLRFKRPLPVVHWTRTIQNWYPPKACMQRVDNKVITSPGQMSEDCLYLNIWMPYCYLPNMTTMVWIHGGSLKSGTSTDPLFNGAKLAASQCVIVVSVNYRLGIFGFLHTEDAETNAGLFDVLLALRFINRSIANFGGTNSSITLFGSGAGAYIVSIFLMSSLGRNLFSKAIVQSGSPLMQMLYQSNRSALEAKEEAVLHLNCLRLNSSDVYACLRGVNATDLVDAHYTITRSMRYRFVTMKDDTFLTYNPLEFLKQNSVKNCSILVGTNKDEGTESLIKILPRDFNTSFQEPPVLTDQKLDRTLRGFLGMLYKAPFVPHIMAALKLIYDYDGLKRQTTNPSLHFLSTITHELAYSCPQQVLIDTYTRLGHKVYVYSFDRAPNITDLPAWVGATHRSEIRYIFRYAPGNQSESFVDEEIELSKNMMQLWASFAKHGDPTPQNQSTPQWQPYMPGHNVMHFTQQATMMPAEDQKRRCPYWNSMPAQLKN